MLTIEKPHADLVHDAELDFYGKRLATSSSDKTVKIFEIDGDSQKLVDTLRGHDGPVWQVAWAHPKFGALLASCSYDGKVIIWKEDNHSWLQVAQHSEHQASVNSVSWAPVEYGAVLLAASSDGKVSITELQDNGELSVKLVQAHQIGVNAASWAPLGSEVKDQRRFVTGGGDNLVKIWEIDDSTGEVALVETLEGHTEWVRDVDWSPSLLSKSYIASGSQDKTVLIWSKNNVDDKWEKKLLKSEKFPDVVWRVSWSLSGNILAVSGGDNKVTLWKENLKGDWEPAGEVTE